MKLWKTLNITKETEHVLRQIGYMHKSETLPDDIFVVSYPKSGNTWLLNMLCATLYRIPLENLPLKFIKELMPGDADLYYKRHFSTTIFKSHKLPEARFQRVIYLLRDGRDAMVSYWHFQNAIKGTNHGLMDVVTDKGIYPSMWHTHVEAWLQNPFQAQMLIVKYEDLHEDSIRELGRICEFIGIEREVGELQWASQQASFDSMRKRESEYGTVNTKLPEDRPFMRKGKVGSYKEEMPPEVLKAFMEKAGDTLKRAGYRVDA